MLSTVRSLKHKLFAQGRAPEDLAELLREIPLALNLRSMKEAVEDTVGYDTEGPPPSLIIIPMEKILSLPWRGGEYHAEEVPPPSYYNLSTASTCTITSQSPGNTRWECERLAAFIRARNRAYDESNTSVVVLAKSNDPWKLEKENLDHAVLMQIVGSLITAFMKHISEGSPLNVPSVLTASNISRFITHNDLDAGIAILSAFPPLNLNGKVLFLIVDLSDIEVSQKGRSKDYSDLIETLFKIALLNKAILIRVEATKTNSECYIHGPGEDGSKELQVVYDPAKRNNVVSHV